MGLNLRKALTGVGSFFANPTIVGGMMGMVGDVYSAREARQAQEDANKSEIGLSREQMAFQERMSSTAHQREVADLEKAGLNPVLSANAGAPGAVGAMPDIEALPVAGVASALRSAREVARFNQEMKESEARVEKLKAEKKYIQVDTDSESPYGVLGRELSTGIHKFFNSGKAIDDFIERITKDDRYISPREFERLKRERLGERKWRDLNIGR